MADSPVQEATSGRKAHHPRGFRESLIELVVIVAIALALALIIQAYLIKPFRIPSESMVPTLEVGQRVLVDRVEGRWGEPERGDVFVFKPPDGAGSERCGVDPGVQYAPGRPYVVDPTGDVPQKMPCPKGTPGEHTENFIKRVVGLPGDRLSVRRGHVLIDGRPLSEPYVAVDAECLKNTNIASDCNFPTPIVIPPDHYFMMGDNRNESSSFDSRFWGPVPKRSLVGQAFATYWPPGRIGGL